MRCGAAEHRYAQRFIRERPGGPVCSGHLSPPTSSPISRGVDDELETERYQLLFCEECGCDSDDEARGWEGHLAREDDGSMTVVIFSPACSIPGVGAGDCKKRRASGPSARRGLPSVFQASSRGSTVALR